MMAGGDGRQRRAVMGSNGVRRPAGGGRRAVPGQAVGSGACGTGWREAACGTGFLPAVAGGDVRQRAGQSGGRWQREAAADGGGRRWLEQWAWEATAWRWCGE
ncbi:hypothetical protein GUJ93_ZPchr0010g8384 [Zizania palustris]|uniref:Uncharacterized protein n=1 Tax=Zizania palustris TaxID=103762 RepID=A0A8J5W1C0_ZIZPA|nr:hypothetical protein GUJ93_ZPchr0010g8384 [Zizania palustris]